jgi:hypothetical protein
VNTDKPLPTNSPAYYRAIADYDGTVRKAAQELSGLTTENLTRWYLDRCTDFYFNKSLRCSRNRYFGRQLVSTDSALRLNQDKVIYRRASRLYVLRKVREKQREVSKWLECTINFLTPVYETSYAQALDKHLYLAKRFGKLTPFILYDAPVYIAARLGRKWLTESEFDPIQEPSYQPHEFGATVARAQLFRQLLMLFEQHMEDAAKPVKSVPRQKIARLSPGITVEQVKSLLTDVGMGDTYTKPGEWAAAFRALVLNQILSGNAPEVLRWAVLQTSVEEDMLGTFKKAWTHELNEANLSSDDIRKAVFRAVQNAARKLLITCKQTGIRK